ncbi:hypothetical protein [Olleya sp. HaHaR_3_96]|uniref:hypothetical protein n=1 Tax=Olleya sp. HaHaR_3_96 TaxID=2745560 RepID=UPI001C4FA57C|nr:hypothetical protein [Olleya sp. HaHaR_3_96]QXP61723.1 hypothetical protein H0I26_08875 [Olleya sp. HaHaR_3_96]
MKTIHLLSVLFIITLTSCNDSKKNTSIKTKNERTIYKTNRGELVVLKIVNDSAYHIDFLSAKTKNNPKTPQSTSTDSILNYFTLIQFEGTVSTNGNKQTLSEKVITNSIKISNGKEIKAPLFSAANMVYFKDSKNLSIYDELLTEKKNLSIEKTLEIVKKHKDWTGEKINLELVEKKVQD